MGKTGNCVICVFAATAILAGGAMAQTEPTEPNLGAYDALSAGNQKIVDSLFEAQVVPTTETGGGTALTKDDIAAMKAGTGWGNVFKQLREQGYVTGKNLGRVISAHNRQANGGEPVVTDGNEPAAEGAAAIEPAGTQPVEGGGGTAAQVQTTEGSFEALSAGNQKVVDSIYEAQFGSTVDMGGGMILTKDEIAAMKGDTGWGNLYKQLQDQGYVTEKDLGQAIRSHNHAAGAGKPVVVTTGSGQQVVSGGDSESAVGQSATRSNGAAKGGGKKLGHVKHGGVTTDGITTGGGTTAAAGPAAHSTAGGGGFGGAGGAKGRGRGGSAHGN